MEVRNRFKGLDLIECLKNYGQRLLTSPTGGRDQDHPQGKCEKAKWLSEEPLQIAMNRSERQRRKGKLYPLECRVPEKSKER